MSKSITIIGCGQLGSRHLQAIGKLDGPLRIQVVEPNENNQQIGHQRLSEVLSDKHSVEVEWFHDLDSLVGEPDLTIVATNSVGRSELLTRLAEMGHRRFLVEKVVCQSSEEYEKVLDAFSARQVKAWVDCGRRYFPFYEQIFRLMENEKIIFFHATGGNHGLGCNAIHFLDLYWRMVRLSKDIRLNGDYLTPSLLANRRGSDLVEFAGTIVASTPEGSFASVSFHPGNDSPVLVNITSENYRVAVDESKNKALLARKEKDWQWEEHEFQILYSSNLTTKIALSIIEQNTCSLPTIQESFVLHKELFRIFNQHVKHVTGNSISLCPIT